MSNSVQENLIGLLLGALEDDERRELEEQLETDPQLRAEFARQRECIEPLDQSRITYEPSFGLADRTFAYVQREAALRENSPQAKPAGMSPAPEVVSKRRSWSLADVVVAGGVVICGLALFLPALFASWESSNRIACEDNLRVIGLGLHDYATQSPLQRLPMIEEQGNRSFAGVFAPTLFDAGYVQNSQVLICASSDLAANGIRWRMPSLEEIDRAGSKTLHRLQRLAGGSYGYNLGYLEESKYRAPSVLVQDPGYVWATDAPAWNIAGRRSENHAGRGQNMLFADQHVQFVVGCIIRPNGDDAFRSDRGLVEAGVNRHDSVIGDSQARPFSPLGPLHKP